MGNDVHFLNPWSVQIQATVNKIYHVAPTQAGGVKKIIMRRNIIIDNLMEEALRLAWDEGPEPAIHFLNTNLENDSCCASLHHALGIIHSSCTGNRKKAEHHFRRAIQLDPYFIYSYWHLSKLLCDEGRHDDALEVYQTGTKICVPHSLD